MQPEKEKGHNPCEMCLCVYFRLSGPYIQQWLGFKIRNCINGWGLAIIIIFVAVLTNDDLSKRVVVTIATKSIVTKLCIILKCLIKI